MMASKLAEKAPGWFTRLLMPEIAEIKGELRAINARIGSLEGKVDSSKSELKSDIAKVEGILKSETARLDRAIQDLDKRLDIVQRLSILEAKQREFEKKGSAQ